MLRLVTGGKRVDLTATGYCLRVYIGTFRYARGNPILEFRRSLGIQLQLDPLNDEDT